jgi:hypothetical protein
MTTRHLPSTNARWQVVPEWSATIDGFNVRCQPIPANHIDMCRFANREEVGYKRVVFLLNNILKRKFQGESRSPAPQAAPAPGPAPQVKLLPAPEARR